MSEINIQEVKNKANNNMIVMDAKDFQQITPILKSLQQHTALILKDYHTYLQNKQRKSVGIPYNLIRKFEVIKNILNQAQHILHLQSNFYKNAVDHREYEKTNQQHFFIQTMKSYDESRREMKAYILKMEGKMQIIEEEVKKDIDYQTHHFTQVWNQIALDRLELNFKNKTNAMWEVKEVLTKNTILRKMLQTKIDIYRSNHIKEYVCSNQQQINSALKCDEQEKNNNKKHLNLQQDIYKIASFLNSYLIKLTLRHQQLGYQLKQIQNQKIRLSFINKQLKKAVNQEEKQIDAKNCQYAIIYELNRSYVEEKIDQDSKTQNITKTDFLIYMRQMQNYVQQRISKYGCSFQYQKGRQKYLLNHNYSKSCQRLYRVSRYSKNFRNYANQKQKNRLQQYKQKFLKDILNERLLKKQLLQIQKQHQNLRLSNQNNNESFLIEQIQHQCKQLQSQLIISNKLCLSQVKAQSMLIPNHKHPFSDSLQQQQQIQQV